MTIPRVQHIMKDVVHIRLGTSGHSVSECCDVSTVRQQDTEAVDHVCIDGYTLMDINK